MRIAIHSASASVTRSLNAIITASGHHLAKSSDDADLVLCDAQHPPQHEPPTTNRLTLVTTPTSDDNEITCPFRPHQLLQRLMMREHTQPVLLANGWSLDLLARALKRDDARPVTLTEKECILLKTLANNAAALTRDDLLECIWGVAGDVDTHTLETHIYRLRAKLGELTPPPCDIITRNGAYMLALGAN